MKTLKRVVIVKKANDKTLCNLCGREIPKTDGFTMDHIHVEKEWGYFSGKDGERHSFDLCESCYDSLVKSFRIPPETKGSDTE